MEALLETLAGRVRELRQARGWSRRRLAENCGLSLRFLARIEAGDGNVSVRRLASIADALDTTPAALLTVAQHDPAVVALVGMRGAGKSTVGPLLAAARGVPFVEMDERIADAAGLPLDQIFELHGERYYRRLERETLEAILAEGRPCVVATGGGLVTESETWDLLRRRAKVVWLKARPEDHWERVVGQGDRRPMADHPDAMGELRALLSHRERRYAQAHVTVDTTRRRPAGLAREIERSL